MHKPAHTSGFAPVKPVTINPEATPVTIFHAEIITGQAVMLARRGPPFRADAFGPLCAGHFVQHTPPAKPVGRTLGISAITSMGSGAHSMKSGRVCGSGAVAVDSPHHRLAGKRGGMHRPIADRMFWDMMHARQDARQLAAPNARPADQTG